MLRENTQAFLEAIMRELNPEDAAQMFGFLTSTINSNPGKLAKIVKNIKDPKTIADIEKLMNGKGSKIEKIMRGKSVFDKILG